MNDEEILTRISDLVNEEHRLRSTRPEDEPERVAALEKRLDQCWDLLRQRQAAREFGRDPNVASARPAEQVERYLQ